MAWSFVAASSAVATGANPTPAVPAGYANGDIFILVASSGAAYSATPPTGYTQLVRNTAASPFLAVWYKVVSGTQTAVAATNANTTSKATVLCYRGLNALDVAGTIATGTTTSVTTTAVTTTVANDLVLNLYGGGVTSSSTGSWSGGSATARVTSGTSTTLGGLYCTEENQLAIGNTTGRAGTLSRASTGTQGVTITFKPTLNNYTLSCANGSYSVTGQAAIVEKYGPVACLLMEDGFYLLQENGGKLALEPFQYILTAAAGSYTVTGQSASIYRNKAISAAAGNYTVTGQAATIKRNKVVSAAAGSYTVTGQTASIYRSKVVTAAYGTYTTTGQAASIIFGKVYNLPAAYGSYSVTGQAATIQKTRIVTANYGTYTVNGQNAGIYRSRVLPTEYGSYTVNGQSAALLKDNLLIANTGAYTVDGQLADIAIGGTPAASGNVWLKLRSFTERRRF